ncbi:MAG: hypothetical protein IPO63_04385 [Bacteroidetes bacterium]|nr:hypothetical protein [Bacteroidota bacterium]
MQRKFKINILYLFFGIAMLSQSSCLTLIKLKMGIRDPKVMDEKLHARYLRKLKAPTNQAYLIDTNYINFLEIKDTLLFRKEKKNHYQVIQALYYGHNQFQEKWFINCYAPGYPKLNWNIDNNFATFPPKTAAPLDTLLSFDRLINHAQSFKDHEKQKVGENEPYTVVFIWNRFMIRETKRLHKLVKENLKKCNEPYRIIYINNDNIFAQSEMELK